MRRSSELGRFGGTFVLAACVVVSTAGCSEVVIDGGAAVKNRAVWKMPLDEFYVYSPDLDNYAEQLLIANCLVGQGYEWPVPWQDVDFRPSEDFNTVGFRLFTVELAKKWGYQLAPPENEDSARLWVDFTTTADSYFPDAKLDEALLGCREDVREQDKSSFGNFDGQNYLAELAMQAEQVVLQDEDVAKATAAWRECLAPRVDFTLPQDPRTGMPPAAAEREWGSEEGTASPKEIADAVADAKCRESSGLSAMAYERSWEEQEKLVTENRDKLDRIRADAVERKAKLLTIVAENAPPAP